MSRRIVLVEDNDDVRNAFAFILRSEGYDVVSFADADSALKHCNQSGAEIAILDVRLPGRAGDDLGVEIRRCWPEARIVFVTGEMDVDALKAMVPGCFVMRKPADIDVLLAILRLRD